MSHPRPAPPTRTASTSTKPPPPPLTQHPTALLHPTCTLTGTHPITLAAHSIVQVRTRLVSTHAPLTIAEGALVSERCSIGFLSPSPPDDPTSPPPTAGTTIHRCALIHPSCTIEASSIGAYAVICAGAKLGLGSVVGEGAKVCSLVEIEAGGVVAPGEVVWGKGAVGERRWDGGMVREGGGGVGGRREGVEGLGLLGAGGR